MENIIHAFLGIFIIMLLLVLGVNTVTASSMTRNAEKAVNNYAQRIEEANYNGYVDGTTVYNKDNSTGVDGVIQKCIQEAIDNNYELTVKVSQSPNNSHVHYGSLELTYYFEVPLVHIRKQRQIIRDLT